MKKLLTTLTMFSLTFVLKANPENSILKTFSNDQSYFMVSMDGLPWGSPSTQWVLGDLPPGNHFLKIKHWTMVGYRPTYQTIYSAYLFIPAQSEIVAVIKDHQWKITEVRNLLHCEQTPNSYQSLNNPSVIDPTIDNATFKQMIASLEKQNFESTRMQLAKQLVSSNLLTARQVARLLTCMNFESSKLDLAKYAYHKTVDKNHYFIVNNVFNFESSILDLSKYISGQG